MKMHDPLLQLDNVIDIANTKIGQEEEEDNAKINNDTENIVFTYEYVDAIVNANGTKSAKNPGRNANEQDQTNDRYDNELSC